MQSLKSRFNGNSGEVIKYAKQFGVLETMDKYEVKDYVAMLNYLKEQEPDEKFQATQVNVDSYAGPDAFDKLLEAILRKYSKMESANKVLVDENATLKTQLDYYRSNHWKKVQPLVQDVFQYCGE
jgi:predicted nucleic acid-binding OB-fold protein